MPRRTARDWTRPMPVRRPEPVVWASRRRPRSGESKLGGDRGLCGGGGVRPKGAKVARRNAVGSIGLRGRVRRRGSTAGACLAGEVIHEIGCIHLQLTGPTGFLLAGMVVMMVRLRL